MKIRSCSSTSAGSQSLKSPEMETSREPGFICAARCGASFLHLPGGRVHKDDVCLSQVDLIEIPPADTDAIAQPAGRNTQPDQTALDGPDLYADSPGFEVTRGDEQHPPISRAEVVENLAWLQVRQLQRMVDPFLVGRNRKAGRTRRVRESIGGRSQRKEC